ncbi:MAG TPA: DUF4291 family protein, partial [Ohtaekwangia sp.]|uniref:DUF4291 family protein n=1 Tax=Ohtaekwangia sp. TaxID=2066019 RepID=UPI002F942E97
SKENFDTILQDAVISSFSKDYYKNEADWQQALQLHEVRLQWDPDHDPFGNKKERRAIQLGLKGNILARYGKEFILNIENIAPFVKQQRQKLEAGKLDELEIPFEEIYQPASKTLAGRIGLS